jgi:hypothetical protein
MALAFGTDVNLMAELNALHVLACCVIISTFHEYQCNTDNERQRLPRNS